MSTAPTHILLDTQVALANSGIFMTETKDLSVFVGTVDIESVPAGTINAKDERAQIFSANNRGRRHENYDGLYPNEEESKTLRKIPGKIPKTSYLLCVIEFAERASWYGTTQVFGNFINRSLPKGGNGAGAPPKGTQSTAGALGQGTAITNAIVESFNMLAYTLPIFGGWLADAKLGRFKTVCLGVFIAGLAHVVLIISSIPSILQAENAFAPFAIGVYMLAIGGAIFKPNISPMLLDQNPSSMPILSTIPKTGERVIIDPEATTERVMLWFYLLINIGGFFGIATSYLAKDVGFWSSFLLPTAIYTMLPPLLWYLYPRLVLKPPGGSDLGNVFRVLGACFRDKGWMKIGRHGFWEQAKPIISKDYGWDDQFVIDVQRTFQVAGIFCFFPIFRINDGGLPGAANAQSVMFTTDGVPNDLLSNLNPLAIIVMIPVFNYGIYPYLRKHKIHFGSIKRIALGMMLCSIFSTAFSVLTYYAYETSPCGYYASSVSCVDDENNALVSPITIWWTAIPVITTAVCEILVNVTAYGLAYSRAPKNMRGLVSALNLFSSGISYAVGLGTSYLIQDPYIIWDFAGPTIVGFILSIVFWFTFKHLDHEEYILSENMAALKMNDTKTETAGQPQSPIDAASEETKIAL